MNDFRVTGEAVPATVLDLAARRLAEVEQRGVDVFYVRIRSGVAEGLTAYEGRVLGHLRRLASGDVVTCARLDDRP